jgi:hypothetical protein
VIIGVDPSRLSFVSNEKQKSRRLNETQKVITLGDILLEFNMIKDSNLKPKHLKIDVTLPNRFENWTQIMTKIRKNFGFRLKIQKDYNNV